jgi:hypothetical protein
LLLARDSFSVTEEVLLEDENEAKNLAILEDADSRRDAKDSEDGSLSSISSSELRKASFDLLDTLCIPFGGEIVGRKDGRLLFL